MKLIVRTIVLMLAAVGVASLYDEYAPRLREARRTGDRLLDTSVRPAVQEAASTLGDAAGHAAATLAGASREVADAVREQATASAPAATSGSVPSTGPFAEPEPHGQDHPLSPMAAEELGVELSR
jgi:hypothetical protein